MSVTRNTSSVAASVAKEKHNYIILILVKLTNLPINEITNEPTNLPTKKITNQPIEPNQSDSPTNQTVITSPSSNVHFYIAGEIVYQCSLV